MSNISEMLQKVTRILQQSGIAEPRREANSLLAFALKIDRTFIIAHPEFKLSEADEKTFNEIIARRANREPFQYITGEQEFYRLNFELNSDVLIPRPETELIVENAIDILQNLDNPTICEVGTGSGCISISILHEVKKATAVGLDISQKALEISQRNAQTHQVLDRLELKVSDVFQVLLDEKFEIIVSNPPYISNHDYAVLQPEVKKFEPQFALTDGKNGLSIIEKIVLESPKFLKSNGYLLMEIGFGQSVEVELMFAAETWQSVEILPDLQGIPRMVKAQIK